MHVNQFLLLLPPPENSFYSSQLSNRRDTLRQKQWQSQTKRRELSEGEAASNQRALSVPLIPPGALKVDVQAYRGFESGGKLHRHDEHINCELNFSCNSCSNTWTIRYYTIFSAHEDSFRTHSSDQLLNISARSRPVQDPPKDLCAKNDSKVLSSKDSIVSGCTAAPNEMNHR